MEKNTLSKIPLVSVIIPTYKRSDRIKRAILSVLEQSHTKTEIIVIDDNNDATYRDATFHQIKDFIENNALIYKAHKTNKGGCAARNTGAEIASGDFITFLDDDDFYEPTKIEKQLDYLQSHSEKDACLCAMYRMDESGNYIESRENFARGTTIHDIVLDGNCFTAMLMIKRAVFNALKGFSEISRFQDRFFLFKFLENGYQVGIIDDQLFTLIEHTSERISLSNPDNVLNALNQLHDFEHKNKNQFSAKEWNYIVYRHLYDKAYNSVQGSFIYRLKGIRYLLKAFFISSGNLKKNSKLFLRLLLGKK